MLALPEPNISTIFKMLGCGKILSVGGEIVATCCRIVGVSSVGGVVQHVGNNVRVVEFGTIASLLIKSCGSWSHINFAVHRCSLAWD